MYAAPLGNQLEDSQSIIPFCTSRKIPGTILVCEQSITRDLLVKVGKFYLSP
jgi:hypothetical protein